MLGKKMKETFSECPTTTGNLFNLSVDHKQAQIVALRAANIDQKVGFQCKRRIFSIQLPL